MAMKFEQNQASVGWACFNLDPGFALAESTIRVNRVHDIIVDEDQNAKTGKQVSVKHNAEPVFLLKGATMLRPGRVVTAFQGQRSLGNRTTVEFKGRWTKCQLSVISDDPVPQDNLVQKTQLVLSSGKQTQVIQSLDGHDDGSWTLLWAGDIDRDGKLDFYLDLSDHYNVSRRKLFLSSQAKKNELVKEVASFTTVGC